MLLITLYYILGDILKIADYCLPKSGLMFSCEVVVRCQVVLIYYIAVINAIRTPFLPTSVVIKVLRDGR